VRMQKSVVFGHRAAIAQARFAPAHHSGGGGGVPWWIFAVLAAALAYGLAMTVAMIRRRSPIAGGPAGQG
jgi:hypothetical protein